MGRGREGEGERKEEQRTGRGREGGQKGEERGTAATCGYTVPIHISTVVVRVHYRLFTLYIIKLLPFSCITQCVYNYPVTHDHCSVHVHMYIMAC